MGGSRTVVVHHRTRQASGILRVCGLFCTAVLIQSDVVTSPFDPQTDWAGFVARNVSVAGLYTGSSAANDPCYHRACDRFPGNIDSTALTINAKAAARAAARVALHIDEMPAADGGQ